MTDPELLLAFNGGLQVLASSLLGAFMLPGRLRPRAGVLLFVPASR